MPSSSVHLPRGLVERLDALASRRGVSRNRVIVEACLRAVDGDAGDWPPGFFDHSSRYSKEELSELRAADIELVRTIESTRRSREAGVFDKGESAP